MNAPVRGSRPRSRDARTWQPREQSRGERSSGNGMGAPNGDEPGGLRSGRNPWTVRNPGRGRGMKEAHEAEERRKPSRSRESSRTERSGVVGTSVPVDAPGDAAKREGTPAGQDVRRSTSMRTGTASTEVSEGTSKRPARHEGMPPIRKIRTTGQSPTGSQNLETGHDDPFVANPMRDETIDKQRPAVG